MEAAAVAEIEGEVAFVATEIEVPRLLPPSLASSPRADALSYAAGRSVFYDITGVIEDSVRMGRVLLVPLARSGGTLVDKGVEGRRPCGCGDGDRREVVEMVDQAAVAMHNMVLFKAEISSDALSCRG